MPMTRVPTKSVTTLLEEPEYLESLRPVLGELERALSWTLAEKGGLKESVVVTIQTKGKKAACNGWFAPNAWSKGNGDPVAELNVTAESLARSPVDIISTMVHEAVHIHARNSGIRDVSSNGYHNQRFAKMANAFGLMVEDSRLGSVGWGWTSASDELTLRIMDEFKPDLKAFDLFKLSLPFSSTPAAPSKMKLWDCGCTKVRCAVELQAVCGACTNLFVKMN